MRKTTCVAALLLVFIAAPAVFAEYSFFGGAALRAGVDEYPPLPVSPSAGLTVDADHTVTFSGGEARLRHSLDVPPGDSGEMVHTLYQADISWYPRESLVFRGGRHQLGWGMGYAFSPADAFHPERDPEGEVRGFDGMSLSWIAAPDWTVTGAVRIDEALAWEGEQWWKGIRYASYLSGYIGGLELAFTGVWKEGGRFFPGAGASFPLLGVIITMEAAEESCSGGAAWSFYGERLSLTLQAEYLWDGGDQQVFSMVSVDIDGAAGSSHSVLFNPDTGSAHFSHALVWTVREGPEFSAEAGWDTGGSSNEGWSAALQMKIYF